MRPKESRKGAAAVEAAICLPVLVGIWLATTELNQFINLRQQTQILAAMSAEKVVRSTDSFEKIQDAVEENAESLGLVGCVVTITQTDEEVVQSNVSIDFTENASSRSLFGTQNVTSTCYSFRDQIE